MALLGIVILTFAAVDPTTSKGRKWLLSKVSGVTDAALQTAAELSKRMAEKREKPEDSDIHS